MSTARLIKELIQFGIEVTEEEGKNLKVSNVNVILLHFFKRFECFLEDFLV